MPQPDLTILRLRPDRYRTAAPGPEDVLLLTEVSDATLHHDRDVKLPLYAKAGIPEVWIFDLERKRVLVYQQPGPDGYEQVSTKRSGQTLAPAAFPDLALPLKDLFN